MSSHRRLVLSVGMLITGTANTILNKWQDMQCVSNCGDPDTSKHKLWEQPLIQTMNMFAGELLCLFFYWFYCWYKGLSLIPTSSDSYTPLQTSEDGGDGAEPKKKLEGWQLLWLWFPTVCDLCNTTLLNVGLLYTTASIFQMLRGGLVLFTGVFAVVFLKKRISAAQWLALVSVTLGIALVGAASIINASSANEVTAVPASKASFGVILILLALFFGAGMFVIEERVLSQYHVEPIYAVGLEGLFGLSTVLFLCPWLYLFWGRSHPEGFFDVVSGWDQFWGTELVWQIGLWICISIAGFNYFGLSVTKLVSSTARATIDASRTLFIWMISLYLGWEDFKWLQVVGFVLLIYGTFLFNGVIRAPNCLK